MKILFLHSLADPKLGGGAEQTLWTLMCGLRDAGHECVLLATSDKPRLHRVEKDGITVWRAGIRNVYWPFHKKRPSPAVRMLWHFLDSYNYWMGGLLRQVVEMEKPDIASLHNISGWSAASWFLLKQLNVPMVQVLHDYYPICVKTTMYRGEHNCIEQCATCRIFRLPHRTLSRQVSAVVGVSRFMLERHQALGYFKGVPIQRVIHNARSPKALGLIDHAASKPHSNLRFGYIGRLDPVKGIELLIETFLTAELNDAELWIAGSGKQAYEHYLYNFVTDSRVRFLGRVEPNEFYPRIDVAVVPSLWNDNLPGVVFEAYAFGKPVIGSRRGGIPEMIHDGKNGLLFEPDEPDQLIACLRRLHDDEVLRSKLTANAQPSSLRYIDLPAWVATYESIYREASRNALSSVQA